MLGKKTYKIMVKDASNEFILGRISGMITMIANNKDSCVRGFAMCSYHGNPNRRIIKVDTTRKKYRKIKMVLEKEYPGVCKFGR